MKHLSKWQRRLFSSSLSKQSVKGHVLSHSNDIIPSIGLGTWGADHFSNDQISNAVKMAITECDYRHIDCATIYNSQDDIGNVLKDIFDNPSISRDNLHITSKIWNNDHSPENVYKSVESTLKSLNVDYIDLMLIHWPFRNDHIIGASTDSRDINAKEFNINEYFETWNALNQLCNKKLIKNIGVSNMTVKKLTDLFKLIENYNNNNNNNNEINNNMRYPCINQVECHPYFQQKYLFDYCNTNNILLTAALPLGSPERPQRDRGDNDPVVLENEILKDISNEIGCSVAQVVISWHVTRGLICVPKAIEKWMLNENYEAANNIKLNKEQMERIATIENNNNKTRFTRGQVFCWKPNQPWQELWDYEE